MSTRPASRKPVEPTLVRVYDVRDLIMPITDMQPPPVWSSSQPASRPAAPGEKTLSPRERLLVQLVDLIRQTVEPSSWTPKGDIGSISELNGSLIITQSASAHGRIMSLIQQLREGRCLQVAVRVRFVRVRDRDDKPLQDWMRSELKCTLDAKTQSAFMNASEAAAFYDHAQEINCEVLASPRLTLFNGQRAYVTMGNQQKYTLPLDKRGQVEMTFQNGATLDICATVSADRKYATLETAPTLAYAPTNVGPAMYTIARAKLTANVPGESALVLRMPSTLVRAVRAREVTDAAGAKSYEVVTEPVDAKAAPSEYVYVLIQPKIIQPREEEETQFPRMAPTSRPPTD